MKQRDVNRAMNMIHLVLGIIALLVMLSIVADGVNEDDVKQVLKSRRLE